MKRAETTCMRVRDDPALPLSSGGMSRMRRRASLLRLVLIITGVAGALGFVPAYWSLLNVANRLAGIPQLRESVSKHSLNLWIWSPPYPMPYDAYAYLLVAFGIAGGLVLASVHFTRERRFTLEPTRGTEIGLRVTLVGLLGLLAVLLGQYPDDLRTSYSWTVATFTGGRAVAVLLTVVVMVSCPYVVAVVAQRLAQRPRPAWIGRWIVWAVVLLFSFLLVYEPGYPLQILHDDGYLAPIHQAINGRTIYRDVASQYLFMGVYPFVALRKLGLLAEDYRNFTVLLTILWVAQLSILFALVRRATRSDYWGLMCVFSTISVSILGPWLSPVGIPNTGPVRWLGFFLLLLLMAYRGHRSRATILLLVAIVLGEVDVGIQATIAYAVYRMIALALDWRHWRRAVEDAILYGLLMGAMFGLVQLFMFVRTGEVLGLSEIFYTITKYGHLGAGMVPMAFKSYLYLLVAVNFLAVVFAVSAILRYTIDRRHAWRTEYAHLLLFSSCLALVASVYYVRRATDGNLFNVAQFTMVPLFLLLPILWRRATSYAPGAHRPALVAHLVIACLLIGVPLASGRIYVGEKLARKVDAGLSGLVSLHDVLSPFIDQDVALMRRSFTDREAVLWLGNDTGTFVLARTGHPSLLYFSPHRWALTAEDLRSAFGRVAADGAVPDRIIVECTDAVRYALARKAGVVFATYDRKGFVQASEAYEKRRVDYERFKEEANTRCRGTNPPRYNTFLPNDLYQDKWNQIFSFAEAASAAFQVAYTLDIEKDCTGHNCLLVKAQPETARGARK